MESPGNAGHPHACASCSWGSNSSKYYVIVCTISMFSASQDRETSRTTVTFIAELIWWFSPVIATMSVIRVSKNTPFKNLIPPDRKGWILCVERSFIFGIPLCAIFAVGDQFLRQIIAYLINQDPNVPIPLNFNFLESVGQSMGYSGSNPKFRIFYFLGVIWNMTIGPFVNLFAPDMESVWCSWGQFRWSAVNQLNIALQFSCRPNS